MCGTGALFFLCSLNIFRRLGVGLGGRKRGREFPQSHLFQNCLLFTDLIVVCVTLSCWRCSPPAASCQSSSVEVQQELLYGN